VPDSSRADENRRRPDIPDAVSRAQFRTKAFRVLGRLSVEDFLGKLTPARLTRHAEDPDLQHLNRYALYELAQYKGEPSSELIRDLIADATGELSRITEMTVSDVMKVLNRLAKKDRRVVADLHHIAADNIRSYFRDDTERQRDIVRMLIALSSSEADAEAKEALASYYDHITRGLQDMYAGLLDVLGRRPLERLGDDAEDMTILITALADGLVIRGLMDPKVRPERYFANIIIPFFLMLSTPTDGPGDVPDESRLFPPRA
jgi:hypothetical protein